MNKAVLKINSFINQNTVLIDDKPVAENSEVMNYYSKPIVQVADKILAAIQNEYNDNFELVVYGNLFEQSFLSSVSKKNEFCTNCISKDVTINISTAERLSQLTNCGSNFEPINLKLITDINVSFPAYDSVAYSDISENVIVVSDDISFISANISGNTGIAFYVGGESQKLGNTYVLGCTAENVQALLNSYVDSAFINPFINSTFAKLPAESKRNIVLVNRVEPVFFVIQDFKVELGSEIEMEIKSIPENIDTSGVVFKTSNGNIEIVGNKILAKAKGTTEIQFYSDSPFPFAKKEVVVFQNIFAEKIDVRVQSDETDLCEGKSYDVTLDVYPADADDLALISIETSDKSIAEVIDDKLVVKAPGSFTLFAKGKTANYQKVYNVLAKINGINVTGIPKQAYLGDTFKVEVSVHPEEVFKSGYKWITSNKTVAVVGVDEKGNEMVKAAGVGEAIIKCVSVDDPNVYFETEIKVESTFSKPQNNTYIFYVGLVATLLTVITAFFSSGSASVFIWGLVGAVASVLSISFEKNTKQKAIFCLIAVAASLIIHILITILYAIL